MANKLQVRICGQNYTLVSDDSREYMLEMADYVDRKMIAVKNMNGRLSTSMAAILVALNVADDFKKFKAAAKQKDDGQQAEIALLRKKVEELQNSSARSSHSGGYSQNSYRR